MLKKLLFVLALLPSFVFAQTNLSQGGTGWTTSTVGQLLVGTSSTLRYSRFNPGTAGSVLQASSTSPFRMEWVATSSLFSSLLSSNNTWTGTNNFTASTTLTKIIAGTSAGLQFFSNGLTQIADFGAGGGSNASFLGGVNITGNLAVDTDTLYVDTTNNRVGIGTKTPGYSAVISGSDAALSIDNNSGSASFIRMNNYGTQRFVLDARSAATSFNSLTAPLTFITSSIERVRIDNSGFVGIGTTSPIAKLDVFGNFNIGTSSISNLFVNTATQKIGFNTSGSVINMDSDFTFQGGTDLMSWKDTSGTRVASVSNLGYFNAASYKGSQVYNDSNDLTLYSIASGKGVVVSANASTSPAFTIKGALNGPQTADYFRIKTYSGTGGDILTVTGTGNVGIGTTTPSSKLDVAGTIRTTTNTSVAAGQGLEFSYVTNYGQINSYNRDASAYTPFRLDGSVITLNSGSNGNVGIGTSTPLSPLEVYSPSGNVGNMARFSSGYSSGGFVSFFDAANNTTRGYFGYGPTLFTVAAIGDTGFRSQGGFAIGTNGGAVRQYINTSGAFGLGGSITNVSTFAGASLVGDSSGNIGIGTTSPTATLQIKGQPSTNIFEIVNSAGNVAFSIDNSTLNAKFWNGNATNPGLSGISDQNTGLFWPTGGTLGFTTNGAEKMRITSAGNVGIGTTTPDGSLHVAGTSGAIFGTATGTVGTLSLTSSAAGSPVSGRLAFGTDGTGWQFRIAQNNQGVISDLMTFVTGGNVGIGTTTPTALLDIYKDQNAVTEAYVQNLSSGTGAYARAQFRNGNTTADALSIGTFGTGFTTSGAFKQDGAYLLSETNLTGGLSIGTRASANLRFYTAGVADANERMTIDSTGNVGIGTTSPVALLNVSSASLSGTSQVFTVSTTSPIIVTQANGRVGIGSNVGTPSAPLHIFTPVANSTTVTGQYIINAGSGAAAGAELLLGYAATTAGSGGIASFYDTSHFGGTIGVKTRLSAGGTTFLTGSVTGDVGIGTTTPSARLAIQGTSGSTTPLFSIASSSGTINPILQVIPVATYGGFVGINAPTPTYQLEISADANSAGKGLLIGQHSADVGAAGFTFQKSRGSRAAPAAVTSGDYTGAFIAQNYEGGTYRSNGSFGFRVNGTPATNSVPGQWFWAASNQSDTDPYTNGTVRMVLDSYGRMGLGTTTPTSILNVATTSTSGSVDMFRISSGISQTIMNILSSGATLFGTSTQATCGSTTCGVTIATTTQVTQGSFAVPEYRWGTGTSTSMTIDWTRANTQNIILGTSAVTITFTNATTTTGQVQKLVICNPAGGSGGAITWGTAITWSAGTAPTQTTTANKCDVWSFISTNATGTARIFGSQSSNF